MTHATRSARKANAARRKRCEFRQRPVSAQEQRDRHERRAAEHAARYPEPPTYSDGYDRKPRSQPACYTFNDPLLLAMSALAARRFRPR